MGHFPGSLFRIYGLKGSETVANDAGSQFSIQYIQFKGVRNGREQCWVPVLYMWTYSLKGPRMMQVPHRLDKEVLGVIYMNLQTSTPKLAFMVELGGSVSLTMAH